MTVYRTCRNCVRDGKPCLRRDELKVSLKGLGLTSIKFTCRERAALYAAGQRVKVEWPVAEHDDPYEVNHYTLETWPATVIRESGARFLIAVDDVLSDYETPASDYLKGNLYARVSATRLSAIDEPARDVCSVCLSARQPDGAMAGCYVNSDDPRPPRNCLAIPAGESIEVAR